MNNKKIFRFLGLAILLIGSLFFILSILYQDSLSNAIEGNVGNYGLIALFLIVFVLEVVPQYLSPHLIMINAWVLGLPLLLITIVSVFAHICASLFGFYLGKKYGLDLVKKIYDKKEILKVDQKMNKYGKWVVLLSAFLPIPYIPIIFGSLNLSWKKFIVFGIIPRGISFILLGLGLFFLNSPFF